MVGKFEDAMYSMSKTINLTDNGKCTECGECCSNMLPLTDKEVSEIRQYIQKNHIRERKHLLPVAAAHIDLTCPFLDSAKQNHKCVIYQVRPMICRLFKCDHDYDREAEEKFHQAYHKVVLMREEFYGKGKGT